MRPYSIAVTPRSSRDPMTRHLPTDTGPAAVHHAAQTDHAVLALHLKSGEGCCNGRDRVPTGAAFPLRAQTALAATSTRAQCSRELRRYGDRKLAACMPPLSQPRASRCLLESFQRTSAVFGASIRQAATLIALPSAESRTLAPASTPCRGFRNQSRGCLRRSRPHVQAHRQRNSGQPPH